MRSASRSAICGFLRRYSASQCFYFDDNDTGWANDDCIDLVRADAGVLGVIEV